MAKPAFALPAVVLRVCGVLAAILGAATTVVAQSADGALQFSGQVSSDATKVSCFVQHNGSTFFPFTATLPTARAAKP